MATESWDDIIKSKPRHGWFTHPGSDADRYSEAARRENLPIFQADPFLIRTA